MAKKKRCYRQLNFEQRVRIETLKSQGLSLRQIAKEIGRDHRTIGRELKRNAWSYGDYYSGAAEAQATSRKWKAGKRRPLKSQEIEDYVRDKISMGWSPEMISGRIREDLLGKKIATESIYQFLYNHASELTIHLVRKKCGYRTRYPRRNKRRDRAPNRIPLSERSSRANTRREFGHWESDTIVSKQCKAALNVLVERKSRYLCLSLMPNKTAQSTYASIVTRLESLQSSMLRSITYDNGTENYMHQEINLALKTKSYFCQPYHSWEKGTVENTNGLIRRYVKKRDNIAHLTEKQILWIELLLNNRPRKCLNFKTSTEVFLALGGALPP